MKSIDVLRLGQHLLTLRRRIAAAHVEHLHTTIVQRAEMETRLAGLRRESAQHRFAVIELVARGKQLTPPAATDPVEEIAQRERRVIADATAKANIRATVEGFLRTQAAQSALDRAEFIQRLKEEVPEDLFEQTLDEYDRRIHETMQDGGS